MTNEQLEHASAMQRGGIRGFFGMKPKAEVKTKGANSSSNVPLASHQTTNPSFTNPPASISLKEDKPLPPLPSPEVITIIFLENVAKPVIKTKLPYRLERIERTEQLLYCSILLHRDSLSVIATDQELQQEEILDKIELDWLAEMRGNPMEQDRMRWLLFKMVEMFVTDATKDSTEIAEIVALAPVLDKEYYRKLLSSIIADFDQAVILDVDLLQGLIQLVQSASPDFLDADDLIKILRIIRTRLQDTHQQSTEHSYHLTLAVSRILDVMTEHKVQDLDRIEEHEPLAQVLSGLMGSSDPYLLYQACYAFQALQYVPDDETPLQVVLRHSTSVANGLVQIMAVFRLDPGSILEGVDNLCESLGGTFEAASTVYDGVCSLMESGQGVFDSLKEGYASGKKRPWYSAIRAAYALAQAGQLKDLKKLIYRAPCRRDPLFQWGVCQLLGEMASDAIWSVAIRQQSVDLLGDLYRNDTEWGQDESVKSWMLNIFNQLGAIADQTVSASASLLLKDLKQDHDTISMLPCPLRSRLSIPKSSPTLAKAQKIPYIEYELYKLRLQRLGEAEQSIYIPPMAKANLQARDDDLFPLMDKVNEFLKSERQ
ncbi:hypothetical protein BG015_005017, partial [Linnemannia schmuckeri]